MKFLILFSVSLLHFAHCFAQNQVGLIPQINSEFRISDSWRLNARAESRQIIFRSSADGPKIMKFDRLDIELVATLSLDASRSLSGGYFIRPTDKILTHRSIQQYTLTRRLTGSRMSHRFRTDQTFQKDMPAQFRFRYRFGWEKPLQGKEIDAGEFYLKLNSEYIGILQNPNGGLGLRDVALLGYFLSETNRIETGPDYRFQKLRNSHATHNLFLNIGFYHRFLTRGKKL